MAVVMRPAALTIALAGVLLYSAVAGASSSNEPTIKDLEKQQQADVSPEPPHNVDSNKTMQSYKRFLDLNAGDAALREEAMRRLGDLNLESSESERIEHELATNEGLRATEAIHLYTALLKTYPKYERNDSVLYQLARAYELNAQPDKALATLDRLVASYPNSKYIDEAQFRRGEILFADKSYPAAQAAYEAVIKFGSTSGFYNQSLYKHGWSLFKQGENERSLDSFANVLDSVLVSKSNPKALVELDTLSKPNRELVEDTFRVMSITFSYNDGAKSIDEFVKHRKQQRPYYYLLYARLGDLYMEKERYTDAADVYRAFVSQDRNNEKAPLLEMQAIEAYSKGGFPDLVLQGKKEFVENYSYGTAFWQGRTPKGEPKVVEELKINLKDVAQYYHAQAQRTQERGGFPGSGEMVPQLPDLVPGRSRLRGHELPAGRYAVREQAISGRRAAVREHRLFLRLPREGGGRGLRGDRGLRQGRGRVVGRGEGEDSPPRSRQLVAVRAGIPDPSGERAGADARGDGSVCGARTISAPPRPRRCCSPASRRWMPPNSALPGP